MNTYQETRPLRVLNGGKEIINGVSVMVGHTFIYMMIRVI